MSRALIHAYYDAFNRVDLDAFCSLLSVDVVHDLNQGKRQIGQADFRAFMLDMFSYYDETVTNLIIFDANDGSHFAAEFVVEGVYKKTAPGMSPANQQRYSFNGGTFFEIENHKIKRVTNYYNVNNWLKQIEK